MWYVIWYDEHMWCGVCLYGVMYIYVYYGAYTRVHCDVIWYLSPSEYVACVVCTCTTVIVVCVLMCIHACDMLHKCIFFIACGIVYTYCVCPC